MLNSEGPINLLQVGLFDPRVVEILKRLGLERRSEKPWFYDPLLETLAGKHGESFVIDFSGSLTLAEEVSAELYWLERQLHAEVRKAGFWPDDDIRRDLGHLKAAHQLVDEMRYSNESDPPE